LFVATHCERGVQFIPFLVSSPRAYI
jgi:hypothetical protein